MEFIGESNTDKDLARIAIINHLANEDTKVYVNDPFEELIEWNEEAFDDDDACVYGLVNDVKNYAVEQDCDRVDEAVTVVGRYAYCDEFPLSNADVESENRVVESLF